MREVMSCCSCSSFTSSSGDSSFTTSSGGSSFTSDSLTPIPIPIPNEFKISALFRLRSRLSTIATPILTGLAIFGYLMIIVFFLTGSFFSLNK